MCDSPETTDTPADAAGKPYADALPPPCRFHALDTAVATESAANTDGCEVILGLDAHGGRTVEVALTPLTAMRLSDQLNRTLGALAKGGAL